MLCLADALVKGRGNDLDMDAPANRRAPDLTFISFGSSSL